MNMMKRNNSIRLQIFRRNHENIKLRTFWIKFPGIHFAFHHVSIAFPHITFKIQANTAPTNLISLKTICVMVSRKRNNFRNFDFCRANEIQFNFRNLAAATVVKLIRQICNF